MHCSAGIGRSGVFCVLDIATRALAAAGEQGAAAKQVRAFVTLAGWEVGGQWVPCGWEGSGLRVGGRAVGSVWVCASDVLGMRVHTIPPVALREPHHTGAAHLETPLPHALASRTHPSTKLPAPPHGWQAVDVRDLVRRLRTQRAGMVQTVEQYVFCHLALLR